MKRIGSLTMPIILAATIIIAGIFAFAPIQQASTVHSTLGQNNLIVLSLDDVILPADSTDVACTITSTQDAIISSIFISNTRSGGSEFSYDIEAVTIGGVDMDFGGEFTIGNNQEEFRDFFFTLGSVNKNAGMFGPLIFEGGEDVVLTFEHVQANNNDVSLDFLVGIMGSEDADITCA